MRVREPVARPLDVVAVELSLTAAQAFLVGVLLYLASGFWADAGLGLPGPAAAILALLGLAIGGCWLYWLAGGVGWPMAAANAPAALFFAFALVMGWWADPLEVGGVPLLLAAAAAVFGVAAGVFLDSPRRWRWDQRERPRSGTPVPRVSSITRSIVAQVPRSLPRRAKAPEPVSELAARIGQASPAGAARAEAKRSAGGSSEALVMAPTAAVADASGVAPEGDDAASELTEVPDVAGSPLTVPTVVEPVLPTSRTGRAGARPKATAGERKDADAIELPTMIEPRAQRSPWAWAAPPEWAREEEDEAVQRPAGRT